MSDPKHIKDLVPDKANARRHTARNIGLIEKSLNEVGAARSIVIDEDNTILAGNGTVDAASQAGITRVRVVEADGNEIIAVRRRGLTPEQKTRLALFDNRSAELAEWDTTVLADLLQEEPDALQGLFSDDELDTLLAGVAAPDEPAGDDPGAQVDKAAELAQKWATAPGQIWSLGEHRLAVGDCRDAGLVARLMDGEKADMVFADPPFGIEYSGHGASKDGRANKFTPIAGDDKPDGEWLSLALPKPGGAIYLKTTWAVLHAWETFLSAVCDLRSHIVWDRCSHSAGDVVNGYATQSEIVLFGSIGKHSISRFDTDVWKIARATTGAPETRTGHPYESPVELPERAIENSSRKGNLVYDPFVGSGTTIIACERLGRRCRAVELDPGYAAVALQRYYDMTKIEPVLVND